MVNRLSPREAMYYFLDPSGATNQLGALLVFDGVQSTRASTKGGSPRGRARTQALPHPAFDYQALVTLVENRLQLTPHYRQVVREVSMGLARPVWADDPDFDIGFHVRRSGLPRSGSMADLCELVARVMSRPLDRSRPLWEMYVIEGLGEAGFAVLTKTHRCLVEENPGTELSEIICDRSATVTEYEPDLWMPGRPPGSAALVVEALAEVASRPRELIDSLAAGSGPIGGVRTVIASGVRQAGDVLRQITDSASVSPLNSGGSASQTFTTAGVSYRSCEAIAEAHGCTVNDVVLAIISGVMRRWLLSVDVATAITDTVRVAVPLATQDRALAPQSATTEWIDAGAPRFVTDLPVGEDNPLVRLAQVTGLATRYAHSSSRLSLGPRPGFGEGRVSGLPEVGSWAFRSLGNRGYNIPVWIAARPISDRYVLGRKVTDVYPVPTLVAGHALAISVLQYRGTLGFTFTADRGVIGDLAALAGYVTESCDELAR